MVTPHNKAGTACRVRKSGSVVVSLVDCHLRTLTRPAHSEALRLGAVVGMLYCVGLHNLNRELLEELSFVQAGLNTGGTKRLFSTAFGGWTGHVVPAVEASKRRPPRAFPRSPSSGAVIACERRCRVWDRNGAGLQTSEQRLGHWDSIGCMVTTPNTHTPKASDQCTVYRFGPYSHTS